MQNQSEKNTLMKKLIFCVLIACSSVVQAQSYDTLRYGDSHYMFNPIVADSCSLYYPNGGYIQMYVADTPTIVYGIAAALPEMGYRNPYYHYTAVLFQKKGRRFRLTDSVERTLSAPEIYVEYSGYVYYNGNPFSDVFHGEEYYFDHPIQVMDTFFIGLQRFRCDTDNYNLFYGIPEMEQHAMGALSSWIMPNIPRRTWCACDEFSIVDSPAQETDCAYVVHHYANWGGVFPITGFHCNQAPRYPAVTVCGPTYAEVGWTYAWTDTYEVAVGDYDLPVDSAFRHYIVHDIHCHIDSLEPAHHYGVWVRKPCQYTTGGYDTTVWSPWSSKVSLMTTVGIDAVDRVPFTLSPNPSRGVVKLVCGEKMHSVGVIDMGGRECFHAREAGNEFELDITALPSGVYVVRIATDSGTFLRRLTKE